MSTTLDSAPPISVPVSTEAIPAAISARSSKTSPTGENISPPILGKHEHLLSSLFTASACLHLLIVGWVGYGSPVHEVRHRATDVDAPPPAIIENIHIDEPPPPSPLKEVSKASDALAPTADHAPAPVAPISAVAANVAVNFAIKVVGPVHLVSTTSESSSSALTNTTPLPTEVSGGNLLTPEIGYPPIAKYKHLTGDVVVEFHTSPSGDISGLKVRVSSGHTELDDAALANVRLGHWVGDAGYFTKSYHFVLR